MARKDDPRVTDLARYKRARELARRKPPVKPANTGFLGSRPRAGLILLAVIVVLTALWVAPAFL